MYQSFEIKNFRCFEDFKINHLSRVNLFSGKNNSGKTALLEAIFYFLHPTNPAIFLNLDARRGLVQFNISLSFNLTDYLRYFFVNFDIDKQIEIIAKSSINQIDVLKIYLDRNIQTTLVDLVVKDFKGESKKISFPLQFRSLHHNFNNTPYKLIFKIENNVPIFTGEIEDSSRSNFNQNRYISVNLNPEEENWKLFNDADVYNSSFKQELIEAIKIFEPRAINITPNEINGIKQIFIELDGKTKIPINYMGEGIKKMLTIVLNLLYAKEKLLLIDEIENGFHYSVLTAVWETINNLSKKYNVQVFATTHSYECIQVAYETFKGTDEFSFFRLENKTKAVRYDYGMYDYSEKNNIEIR